MARISAPRPGSDCQAIWSALIARGRLAAPARLETSGFRITRRGAGHASLADLVAARLHRLCAREALKTAISTWSGDDDRRGLVPCDGHGTATQFALGWRRGADCCRELALESSGSGIRTRHRHCALYLVSFSHPGLLQLLPFDSVSIVARRARPVAPGGAAMSVSLRPALALLAVVVLGFGTFHSAWGCYTLGAVAAVLVSLMVGALACAASERPIRVWSRLEKHDLLPYLLILAVVLLGTAGSYPNLLYPEPDFDILRITKWYTRGLLVIAAIAALNGIIDDPKF